MGAVEDLVGGAVDAVGYFQVLVELVDLPLSVGLVLEPELLGEVPLEERVRRAVGVGQPVGCCCCRGRGQIVVLEGGLGVAVVVGGGGGGRVGGGGLGLLLGLGGRGGLGGRRPLALPGLLDDDLVAGLVLLDDAAHAVLLLEVEGRGARGAESADALRARVVLGLVGVPPLNWSQAPHSILLVALSRAAVGRRGLVAYALVLDPGEPVVRHERAPRALVLVQGHARGGGGGGIRRAGVEGGLG